MQKVTLGRTGLEVSHFCLGTMTWGSQNSEAEAHAQIDRAEEAGIDFMDTAELYPTTPVRAETTGRTEEIIGSWVAKSGRRDRWVIATKVTGPNGGSVRGGQGFDGPTIRQTVEASLRRLRTDYIDLYQLHWPMRGSYMFRRHWSYDPSTQDPAATEAHMRDVLAAMADLIAEGKVRHFALSNETVWGTAEWLRLAAETGGPRVASIQNEYSLLCRLFDTDWAELAHNEDVTLLAWSPLAAGLLSGKYQNGAVPAGSRLSINEGLGGRVTPRVFAAVEAYLAIARRYGIDPAEMAYAWCRTRPFRTIPIFGATSMEQLETAIRAASLVLPDEVLSGIEAAHREHPMPF